MTAFEIVAGVLMLIASIVIIGVVLSQESKGQGLSGVITGGADTMMGESRARSKEARQAKVTRIVAIVFFALTILVNFSSIFAK